MTVATGSSIGVIANSGEGESTSSELIEKINFRVALMCAIAGLAMVSSFIQTVCWMVSGERITASIRRTYFASLLQHNSECLNQIEPSTVTEAMSSKIAIIQDGISQKLGFFVCSLTGFVAAFVIAFYRNWKLALILSSVVPAMFIPVVAISTKVAKGFRESFSFVSDAQVIASEALSALKVVQGMQARCTMVARYQDKLALATSPLAKTAFWQAAAHGWVYFCLFATYALALWESSRMLAASSVDIGVVINVLFSIVIGVLSLSRVSRSVQELTVALSAAKELLQVISDISTGEQNEHPERHPCHQGIPIVGAILFRDVGFSYPSRPEVRVLDTLNLEIQLRKTTAIVGGSGGGKSTLVKLLQRCHAPSSGEILLNSKPITHHSIVEWRRQISFLPQEPVIFSMTVYENVRLGLIGTSLERASDAEQQRAIVDACVSAGISQTIEGLSQGYDTILGSAGVGLSGGQKQRLALARALVRNPSLLILDEPTSALDHASQSLVQSAIQRISIDRTVIIIAHRLETIKNADTIVVLDRGTVAESGSHQELLLLPDGLYATFYHTQNQTSVPETSKNESLKEGDGIAKVYTVQEVEKFINESLHDRSSECQGGPQRSVLSHIRTILRLNKHEKHLIIFGYAGSIISPLAYPAQAFLFAKMIRLSTMTTSLEFDKSARLYSLLFLAVGLGRAMSIFTAFWTLEVCRHRMINRARRQAFEGILEKDISWFIQGDGDRSPASLTFCLLNRCSELAGLHGFSLAVFAETATVLASSAIFSIVLAWKYALVVLCTVPLVFITGFFRLRAFGNFPATITQWHLESNQIACEAVGALPTIVSFGAQDYFQKRFDNSVNKASKLVLGSIWLRALFFAITQGSVFFVNAFSIWYGTRLMTQGQLGLFEFFAIMIALTLGTQDAGEFLNRAPDFAPAIQAAEWFWSVCDKLSQPGSSSEQEKEQHQQHLVPAVAGRLDLHNVSYDYSDGQSVLSDINMTVRLGQHIAIVGPSGSGKSTLLDLLGRFYTARPPGSIMMNGVDINATSLDSYRSVVSMVPQEPSIFSGSIRFNIALGHEFLSDEELTAACREADILHFIQSLPQGINTICKQTELSLGQKQRLAIARALLRDPQILLLDEPTASLDSRAVQRILAPLQSVKAGRTTITVAHDLANVRHCDMVYILREGRVIESGKPVDLMNHSVLFSEVLGPN